MPLTSKGRKILSHLEQEYGSKEKARTVLYAGANKGTFTGIHDAYVNVEQNAPNPLEYRVWLNAKDAADFRDRMHKALDRMMDARGRDAKDNLPSRTQDESPGAYVMSALNTLGSLFSDLTGS